MTRTVIVGIRLIRLVPALTKVARLATTITSTFDSQAFRNRNRDQDIATTAVAAVLVSAITTATTTVGEAVMIVIDQEEGHVKSILPGTTVMTTFGMIATQATIAAPVKTMATEELLVVATIPASDHPFLH